MSEIEISTYTLPDGRHLCWREAGIGRTVVLLHGWAMSSTVFAEVQAELARDFRVLTPDLRGHGGSEANSGYALADFVGDLEVWLVALGLADVALIGWSLGGEVAQLLALRQPQRISTLLLAATTPRFAAAADWAHGLPETQLKAMARDLKRNYLATMDGFFKMQFGADEVDRERYQQIVNFAVRVGRLPLPEVALATLATLRVADLRPQLAQIRQPALILHGALDRIIPAGAGRFLAVALPNAHYVEWPDVGHAPFLSRPQAAVQLWREFLA